MTKLYLSSMESLTFDGVHECTFIKQLSFNTGKPAAFVKLEPAVNCQHWGFPEPVEYVVLASRHQGFGLFPIREFPCFVHIAIPKNEKATTHATISEEDLHHAAWGELYQTAEDASEHRFD